MRVCCTQTWLNNYTCIATFMMQYYTLKEKLLQYENRYISVQAVLGTAGEYMHVFVGDGAEFIAHDTVTHHANW